MSSPCPLNSRALTLAFGLYAVSALAGCDQDKRAAAQDSPVSEAVPQSVVVSGLFPAEGKPPAPDAEGLRYVSDPQAIAEGKRLFGWYNCSGCHFHGGGGIGPALMDQNWIYGGRMDQIFESIYQGRPNGMPTWSGIIPPTDIWKIAAYVHSLPDEASKMPVPTQPPAAVPEPAEGPAPAVNAKTEPTPPVGAAQPAK